MISQRHIRSAIKNEREFQRQAARARARVTPIIGMDAAMESDSAATLFRAALQQMGIDVTNVEADGLEQLFDYAVQLKSGATSAGSSSSAMDSAAIDDFNERFGITASPKKL